MAARTWLNTEINLFDVTIGIPLHLPRVNIPEIKWPNGNPRNGVKAIVTMAEELHNSTFLIGLSEDDKLGFDLTRQEFGLRSEYDLGMVVAQFRNCEILLKWVDDLVVGRPDLMQAITIFVQMRVDFRMLK